MLEVFIKKLNIVTKENLFSLMLSEIVKGSVGEEAIVQHLRAIGEQFQEILANLQKYKSEITDALSYKLFDKLYVFNYYYTRCLTYLRHAKRLLDLNLKSENLSSTVSFCEEYVLMYTGFSRKVISLVTTTLQEKNTSSHRLSYMFQSYHAGVELYPSNLKSAYVRFEFNVPEKVMSLLLSQAQETSINHHVSAYLSQVYQQLLSLVVKRQKLNPEKEDISLSFLAIGLDFSQYQLIAPAPMVLKPTPESFQDVFVKSFVRFYTYSNQAAYKPFFYSRTFVVKISFKGINITEGYVKLDHLRVLQQKNYYLQPETEFMKELYNRTESLADKMYYSTCQLNLNDNKVYVVQLPHQFQPSVKTQIFYYLPLSLFATTLQNPSILKRDSFKLKRDNVPLCLHTTDKEQHIFKKVDYYALFN